MTDGVVPGEVFPGEEPVVLNEGRETVAVAVANTGDRPVQVGSHFHFFEANAALEFDREAAFGRRLDVPAGTAVRFEPGDERTVELVDLGGKRVAHGMNGLVNGSVDGDPSIAMDRARRQGFGGIPTQPGRRDTGSSPDSAGATDDRVPPGDDRVSPSDDREDPR